MITPAFAGMMARYNRWQNSSLLDAAGSLSDAERWAERGAFWHSIAETFQHILWADRVWLARFGAIPPFETKGFADAAIVMPWPDFVEDRRALDDVVVGWADGLDQAFLDGMLDYRSIAGDARVGETGAFVVHFFNHGTHHRGQIHGMLTAAGARPGDTDLFLMPASFKEYRP